MPMFCKMTHRLLLFSMLLVAIICSAQPTPQVVNLWPSGHSTLQGANEKEATTPANVQPGQRIASIVNVHTPSIEVHLASPEKNTGTALIVAPGGGHRQIVWGSEGTDLLEWLNGMGVNVFILKYRLAQTPNYKYTVEGEALQDTQRAIRIVRERAKEWRVNLSRIGVLGFSAGGALGALADIRFDRGKADAADPIDRQSCRPDFVGLVYPGWAPMDITAPKDAPPAFLTSAGLDDAFHAKQTVEFHDSLFKAGVQTDLHIYAHGGHGGGIKPRDGIPFGSWPKRFEEWLADLGMLKPATGLGASFKGPIGLELYSLREQLAKDVPSTLDRVRDFGFQYVEVGNTYKLAPEEFRKQLESRGLKPISGLYDYARYRDDVEGVAKEAKALGLQYVGCAWIAHKTGSFNEADMRGAIEVFNRAGAALAKHGLKFFYHTHGYEFQPYGDGSLFDLMMKETKSEFVRYQMDIFWIVHPGQDPVKLLEKYGNRFELMHIKDMRKGTPTGLLTGKSDITNDVAFGTGIMKWSEILKAAQKAGVKWYFIEDESPVSIEQIPVSMRFLEQIKF